MGNLSGEMETLRKNQKKILEIKNTVTETKNAFDGLISRLCMAKERISELKNMPIETSSRWNAKRKKEKGNIIFKDCETVTKGVHIMGMPEEEEREKGAEKIIE